MTRDDRTPGRRFTVERRGRPDTPYQPSLYASQAGDARRQGRAGAEAGAAAIAVTFFDNGRAIEARLGVVSVGRITIDPTGGFLWVCDLPLTRAGTSKAADLPKAEAAIEYQIRQWCEAAGLISARRKGAS